MKVNYHIHSIYSDGETALEDMVKAAINNEFHEIGFTDHLTLMKKNCYETQSLNQKNLEKYINEIRNLQKNYSGKIKIKSGLEIDYIPSTIKIIEQIISSFNFDFLIGSVHYIDEWAFDLPESQEIWGNLNLNEVNKLYDKYYRLLTQAVETGLFDIVGHLDVIKKFGYKQIRLKEVHKLIKKVNENGLVIEVNSSGLKYAAREIYPSLDILNIAFDEDTSITLATDAHKPEEINYRYTDLIEQVKKAGYTQTVIFNRQSKSKINF